MGIFDFLRKADPPAQSNVRAIAFLDGFGPTTSTPTKLKEWAELGYEANVTVFACVNEVATAVSSLHWRIMQGEAEKAKPVPQHPLTNVLKVPNEGTTWRDFIYMDMAFLLLTGESYAYGTSAGLPMKPARSPLVSLYNIPPDMIKPVKGATLGTVERFIYGTAGEEANAESWHPSRVMFRKTFNPRDISRGLSPLKAAWKAVSSDNAAADWNISLLTNGGRISGMLVTEGTLTEVQRAAIKKQLAGVTGSANAGKVLVLEGEKANWTPTSSTPTELDWLAGRKLSKQEICQVFQVPAELIGDGEHKTYNNYAEARRSFWTETVLPHADRLEASLNALLAPFLAQGQRLEYDRLSIDALKEDQALVETRALARFQAGAITANEFRALVGMEPAKDELADTRVVSQAGVPAGDLLTDDGPDPDAVKPLPATQAEEDAEELDEEEAAEKALALLDPELKLLGAHKDPDILWRKLDARYRAHVKLVRPQLKRLVNGDLEAASEAVRSAPDVAHAVSLAEAAVAARRPEWERTLKRAFRKVGLDFASATDRGLKSDLAAYEVKAGPEARRNAWETAVEGYWSKTGATKVAAISDYTKSKIRKQLREGFEAGEGLYPMAKRIEGLRSMTPGRAERIARTEVLAAGNSGSLAAAESFGVPMKKLWLTTRDDRTRGLEDDDPFDHLEPDGQAVKLDQPFTVGGELLMFPGDSSMGASAGNVVNCRCALSYEVDL